MIKSIKVILKKKKLKLKLNPNLNAMNLIAKKKI